MNEYAWAGHSSALFVIVAGVLLCFFGYRILKVSLGLMGFILGAYGGWQAGLAIFHGSTGTALVCALIGGIIGMLLCLLVFQLGVFCVGAAAGTAIAAAVLNGGGHHVPPIVLIALPIAFGIIALIAQKFMIAVSTAFSGAYLITAGIWPFVAEGKNAREIWLHPAQVPASGTLTYGSLAVWLILALVGVSVQLRSCPRRVETAEPKK
jgi:hypothetical protein